MLDRYGGGNPVHTREKTKNKQINKQKNKQTKTNAQTNTQRTPYETQTDKPNQNTTAEQRHKNKNDKRTSAAVAK